MLRGVGYLDSTKGLGIVYSKGTTHANTIIIMVDTDFATCPITRRSVVMVIVFLNGGPIYWKCKLLDRPTGSTLETEICGLDMGSREAQYWRALMEEVGFPQTHPTIIYCDNDGAVLFGTKCRITQLNKHIDIKYMVIKWLKEQGVIDPRWIPSKCNIADIGTKIIQCVALFQLLRDSMLHRLRD